MMSRVGLVSANANGMSTYLVAHAHSEPDTNFAQLWFAIYLHVIPPFLVKIYCSSDPAAASGKARAF